MLSLPLTSAGIISRQFVNIDQARQYVLCEFKLFETLIRTETEDGGEGEQGVRTPAPLENHKLSFVPVPCWNCLAPRTLV